MLITQNPLDPITTRGIMSKKFVNFVRETIQLVNMVANNVADETIELAYEEEISLIDASAGFGECMIGDNQEYSQFRFSTDGTVTLFNNSANTVNTDINVKFCVYPDGTTVKIKNRLGTTLVLRYHVKYNLV